MDLNSRVIIIGAGIVGTNVADELVSRGWKHITVVEQGPLRMPGGSTSHAPGLVFQSNPSKSMSHFAQYTVSKLLSIEKDGMACFNQVGGLEIATTDARLEELKRKRGFAASWGIETNLLSASECRKIYPLLSEGAVLGGLYIPSDGLALAARATQILIERTQKAGVSYLEKTAVTGIAQRDGHVTGVITRHGRIDADIVISCAGFWGVEVGKMVGLTIPLVPMGHQYVKTTPILDRSSACALPDSATLPILRYQDQDLYYREHGDRFGIGSYGHRPMPVRASSLGETPTDICESNMPSRLPFTSEDFRPAWTLSQNLLPCLRNAEIENGFNGILSFTPDGGPLLGQSATVENFWVAEAVWVTHSAGVARALAQILTNGTSEIDVSFCDLNRFEDVQLSEDYISETCQQSFEEVYDIMHPYQPKKSPRNLRVSPFYDLQVEAGAAFFETGGWERPEWYATNQKLLGLLPEHWHQRPRDPWSAMHSSPITAAEVWSVRTAAGLFDLSANRRIDVSGPGAMKVLQRLVTKDLSGPAGTITHGLLLNSEGRILSDITVARLSAETFLLNLNGPSDHVYIETAARRHLLSCPQESVSVRDMTGGTCCLGLWGPASHEVISGITAVDISAKAMSPNRIRHAYVAGVRVIMMSISVVGEPGWEICASSEHGRHLWSSLLRVGEPHGLVVAGRGALFALRLESGHRFYGIDMTSEHTPAEAGLISKISFGKEHFIGRDALHRPRDSEQRLGRLLLEDVNSMVLGKEPVYVHGRIVGYVTSAAFAYTVGRPIAFAWLANEVLDGEAVEIEYFARRIRASVMRDRSYDRRSKKPQQRL